MAKSKRIRKAIADEAKFLGMVLVGVAIYAIVRHFL